MSRLKVTAAFSALALLGGAMGAAAEEAPRGVSATGELAYEYLSLDSGSGSDTESLVFGDIDLSFAPGAISGGIGFDFGLYGVDIADLSEIAFFATISYDTGSGVIRVGAPRGAMKSFSRMPDIGGNHLAAVEFRTLFQGAVDLLSLLSDDQQYGLRYDGQFGGVDVGASYHRFGSDLDADVIDLGASYEMGDYFVAGGAEFISSGDEDAHIVHVEGGLQGDAYEAGLGLTSSSDFLEDAAMAWFTYSALPNTDLTASVITGDDFTAWGLSAEWRFLRHSFIRGGVLDTDSDSTLWSASVGLKF